MSAQEWREWLEFYRYEPFGSGWQQAALVAAVVANGTPGRRKAVSMEDFLPVRPPRRKQTDAEIAEFFCAMFQPKGEQQKQVARQIVADLQ